MAIIRAAKKVIEQSTPAKRASTSKSRDAAEAAKKAEKSDKKDK